LATSLEPLGVERLRHQDSRTGSAPHEQQITLRVRRVRIAAHYRAVVFRVERGDANLVGFVVRVGGKIDGGVDESSTVGQKLRVAVSGLATGFVYRRYRCCPSSRCRDPKDRTGGSTED